MCNEIEVKKRYDLGLLCADGGMGLVRVRYVRSRYATRFLGLGIQPKVTPGGLNEVYSPIDGGVLTEN